MALNENLENCIREQVVHVSIASTSPEQGFDWVAVFRPGQIPHLAFVDLPDFLDPPTTPGGL